MDFETILYESADGVAVVTLNRPKRLNAITLQMARELKQAWEHIKKDPQVVCVIVTGAGERALCTGVDVADVAAGETRDGADDDRATSPFVQLTAIQNRCWKPVITAVNGMACGGGLHFVADSDLVICSEGATFFDTHVKVGLIAGLEPVGLARRIPLEAVLRMALSGGDERIDARRALEIGLVGEVLPAAELMPRARALAAAIARHSPTALVRSKRAIWESLDMGLEDALDRTWTLIREHNAHPDIQEGTLAFVEKRAPRWSPPES